MTIEQFNNTHFLSGMKAKYKDNIYPIVSCDFEEHLVALSGITLGSDDPDWVRCENIDLVSA